ncbi:uncharacterized protein N7446_006145 [Penicillium canescens]|uniref:Uncharacterized protein n=1 Tax=Penicillium canescens TaxID=5083 RepID=A0AAD6IJ33_PENCN|nr:uncharacterized protein N7446_006145 [Penicillium canescens]KAJ6051512.1 hypothetical protein N7460_002046 [Penicillium canescens]KAJ6062025.1 hypothetical protein N7446_006145 [Penicillium canescens]KAJ6065275.1 hypothetical protein N7444_000928 [Penicillium canescens]
MGSFSDEQFERLLAGLDQNTDSEPFENFLGNLEDMPDIAAFSSFCDPTLVPMMCDLPESLLSFPPLPPIEEEVSSPNTPPVQPSDESPSAHSIPTSAPEINEALETAHWAKFLVESQRSQLEAMKVELDKLKATFEQIRKYQVESLNPWVLEVHNALQALGYLKDEPPASATDGEFDISIIDFP